MNPSNSPAKTKVLVVPLNWGLGHATRLIPVIRELLSAGMKVIVSGSDNHKKIFREEFGNLEEVDLPFLRIRLSGGMLQLLTIAFQIPRFLFQIRKEHVALKYLIRKHNIDIIISDNCYGLWNHSICSVFITHQLHIKLPAILMFLEKPLNNLNHYFISKFDECWIADKFENHGFAGDLSHPPSVKFKSRYIGILSRFDPCKNETLPERSKKLILFILSGPERQRTHFENIIIREIERFNGNYDHILIQGLPDHAAMRSGIYIPFADPAELRDLILKADIVICRGGYSTIMDLVTLGKAAVLVPTPGQTEQEYLATYLSEKGFFQMCTQDSFNLKAILTKYSLSPLSLPVCMPDSSLADAVKSLQVV